MKHLLAVMLGLVIGCGGPANPGQPDARGGGGDDDAAIDAPPDAAPVCGDGVVDPNEVCDDHNAIGSDGCSADCTQIESGFLCPVPGVACVPSHVCGNGILELDEQCDDHNLASSDGCTAACALEPGWACPVVGIRCTAASCGDGIVAGFDE